MRSWKQTLVIGFTMLFALVLGARAGEIVIYYSFDALKDGKVPDLSGNDRNATIQGDVTLVDGGKFGKAARFQNKGFLDLDGPKFPAALIPKEAVTIAAWAKVDSLADHHAFFNARASDQTWVVHPEIRTEGNFRWLLRSDGGKTIFDIRAGSAKANVWLHFAGVYDSKEGMARLFIDGEEVGSKEGKDPIAKDWGMGARVGYNIDNARPFTGLMDDFVMYNRALKGAEVKNLMAKGPGIPTAVSPQGRLALTWGALKAE